MIATTLCCCHSWQCNICVRRRRRRCCCRCSCRLPSLLHARINNTLQMHKLTDFLLPNLCSTKDEACHATPILLQPPNVAIVPPFSSQRRNGNGNFVLCTNKSAYNVREHGEKQARLSWLFGYLAACLTDSRPLSQLACMPRKCCTKCKQGAATRISSSSSRKTHKSAKKIK